MADKKTFLMYKSWNPMLENLPYDKLGELMYYILKYQDGEEGSEPTDPMVAAMFAMIKSTMDIDAEKYAETCAKRAENGKQGGRPRKQEEPNESKEKQRKANGFTEKQNEAKKADNDNEYDNDNDIDNVNDIDIDINLIKKKKTKEKKKTVDYEDMVEKSSLPMSVADKVMEWVTYKTERKEAYKEIGFKAFITQVEGHVLNHGSDAVIEVINSTMASGYKGVVWDWLKNAKPKQTGKVDWDSL